MSGEGNAVSALTLLIAVCEQALLELAQVDPPVDGPLGEQIERLRDLCTVELTFGRFGTHGA